MNVWGGIVTAALVASACGGRGEPPGSSAVATAAARTTWLTGDVDGAIAKLVASGGDRSALGALARAYDVAGKPGEAKATLGRLPKVAPRIAPDTSRAGRIVLAADGAMLAIEDSGERSVRVFDVLTGRDRFAVPGHAPAFAIDPKSKAAVLAVIPSDFAGLAIYDAATGAKLRQIDETEYSSFFAIDALGVVTLVTVQAELVQCDLSTGAKLREIPLGERTRMMIPMPIRVANDSHTLQYGSQIFDSTFARLSEAPAIGAATNVSDEQLSVDGRSFAVAAPTGELSIEEPDGTLRAHLPAGTGGSRLQWLADDTLLAITATHVRHFGRAGKLLGEIDLPDAAKPPFATGVGGQLVARGGSGELLVYALGGTAKPTKTEAATLISRFGGATQATALAWSRDGKTLAIASANGRVTTWATTGDTFVAATGLPSNGSNALDVLAYDTTGALINARPRDARIDHVDRYVFAYPPAAEAEPTRYWELPSAVAAVSRGADRIAAVDQAGVVHVFDAATGEGLGELGTLTGGGISGIAAIAMRPDGKTLAIARTRGGIELWDLPARARVLELAGGGTFAAVDASGAVAGDLSLIAWPAGDANVDAVAAGAVAGVTVAATALAKPPSPVTFAATPAPSYPPRAACIPLNAEPIHMRLAGDTLAFCVVARDTVEPSCFTADLAAKTIAPTPTPPGAFVDRDFATQDPNATLDDTAAGTKDIIACAADDKATCHRLPFAHLGEMTVSADATLAAVDRRVYGFDDDRPARVETWNAVTGMRIASFDVRCPDHSNTSPYLGHCTLEFVGHALIAYQMPCAQPCSVATMYNARGKFLGNLASEASTLRSKRFHDELYVLHSFTRGVDDAFVVQDMATGKVALERDADAAWDVRTTPDQLVRVVGATPARPARVEIWGPDLTQRAEIAVPTCAPASARP